ncbi:MAG: hypothetical protein ACYTHM_21130 [Planctomycetota bacterium]|jgi:hypothetical protein
MKRFLVAILILFASEALAGEKGTPPGKAPKPPEGKKAAEEGEKPKKEGPLVEMAFRPKEGESFVLRTRETTEWNYTPEYTNIGSSEATFTFEKIVDRNGEPCAKITGTMKGWPKFKAHKMKFSCSLLYSLKRQRPIQGALEYDVVPYKNLKSRRVKKITVEVTDK